MCVCVCVCIYITFYTIYKTRIQCESLLPFHPFCFLLPLARVAPSKGHPPSLTAFPTCVSSFRYLLYKVFPILRCNFSSRNVSKEHPRPDHPATCNYFLIYITVANRDHVARYPSHLALFKSLVSMLFVSSCRILYLFLSFSPLFSFLFPIFSLLLRNESRAVR